MGIIKLSELGIPLYDAESPASQQAKQMGLIYKGFGRWADPQSGKVTHKSQGDRLIPWGDTGFDGGRSTPVPDQGQEPPDGWDAGWGDAGDEGDDVQRVIDTYNSPDYEDIMDDNDFRRALAGLDSSELQYVAKRTGMNVKDLAQHQKDTQDFMQSDTW